MIMKLLYQKRQTGKTYKLIGKALKYDCSHRKVLFITLPINYDAITARLRYHKIGHNIDIKTMASDDIFDNLESYDLVLLDEFDFIAPHQLSRFTNELQKFGIKVYGLSSKKPTKNTNPKLRDVRDKSTKLELI